VASPAKQGGGNEMAQYTVTAGCGHTTNINLVGPITERNRRLCWMQSTDGKCNPCYAMMKRAEEHTQEEIEAKRMAEQLRAQQMDADYADKVLRLETQANEELLLKADPAKVRKARQVLRALEMVRS